ncbi:MAG: Ig-like domain-containing protein, partial [Armatimonadetes bacterium]|nr:Ig-like domain-containing protein [Candidatus Hippobium faecium]
ASVTVNVVPNEEATIDLKGDSYVLIGKSINLSAVITPETESQDISWSSSDWNVARVVSGVVTGKKAGTVTITAQSIDNPSLVATKTVYVVSEEDMPKFEVNPQVIAGGVGSVNTLTATTNIEDSVIWTVGDDTVASINPTGPYTCDVTNLAIGTTSVVATITDKYGEVHTQVIYVTVHE